MRYLTALETQIVTGTSDHEQQQLWFENNNIQMHFWHGRVNVHREQLPADIVAPLVAYETQGYTFTGGVHGFANPPIIDGSA